MTGKKSCRTHLIRPLKLTWASHPVVPAGTPTGTFELLREVNVITFNEASVLGSAALQDEPNGLRFNVDVPDADRGWADLTIERDQDAMRWDVDL